MTLFDLVGKTVHDSQVDESYREVGMHTLEKIVIDKDNIQFLCDDGTEFTLGIDKHNELLASEEDEYNRFKIEIMSDEAIIENFINRLRC